MRTDGRGDGGMKEGGGGGEEMREERGISPQVNQPEPGHKVSVQDGYVVVLLVGRGVQV